MMPPFPQLHVYDHGVRVEELHAPFDATTLELFVSVFIKPLAPSSTLASGQPTEAFNVDGVVVWLNSGNFDAKIKNGPWLVKFFTPQCSHCQQLAPTWKQLAVALKGEVNVAEVDCSTNSFLANSFNIRGYPTIKFFRNGNELAMYKGSRSLENLREFGERLSKFVFYSLSVFSVLVPLFDS